MKLNQATFTLILCCLFTIFNSSPSWAANGDKTEGCSTLLNPTKDEAPAELIEQFLVATVDLIVKGKTIPSRSELAKKLNIKPSEVTAFLKLKNTPRNLTGLVGLAKEKYPEPFDLLRHDLYTKFAGYLKDNLKYPTLSELSDLLNVPKNHVRLLYGDSKNLITEAEADHPKWYAITRNKVMKAFTTVSRETRRTATFKEVAQNLGLTEKELRRLVGPGKLFEDIRDLHRQAKEANPKSFIAVNDLHEFDSKRQIALMKAIKTKKRLLVTTAVAGAPVNRPFFDSLLNYAKEMDAEIIVYPANMMTTGLDPILLETPGVHVLLNSVELNEFIKLNNIKITAKHINPLQGLDKLGARGQSQIVGSPKMHMTVIPKLDRRHPHKLLSTAAITDPHYAGKHYIQGRTDEIAKNDHMLGAVVLERSAGGPNTHGIDTWGSYHVRHIEFSPDINEYVRLNGYKDPTNPEKIPDFLDPKEFPLQSGFTDLNRFYSADKLRPTKSKALILGDIHVGDTDQTLMVAVKKLVQAQQPEYIVLHDLYNGHAVNKHEKNNRIAAAKKVKMGRMEVEKEISNGVTFVEAMLDLSPSSKVIIVKSNHNDWLYRWLDDKTWMDDDVNLAIAAELFNAVINHGVKDPLEYAFMDREKSGISPTKRKRVIFVEGQQFREGPSHRRSELGQHGHSGANGGRGSMRSFERAFERGFNGHTHTIARRNGVINVGTATTTTLPYASSGASSWSQGAGLLDEWGGEQLLVLEDGEFFTPEDTKPLSDDAFFQPGYPIMIENNHADSDVGQIDQYSHHLSRKDQE